MVSLLLGPLHDSGRHRRSVLHQMHAQFAAEPDGDGIRRTYHHPGGQPTARSRGPPTWGPIITRVPKAMPYSRHKPVEIPEKKIHEQSTSNDAEDIRRAAGLWSHPRGRTPETIRAQRDGERQRSPTGCSDASHEQGGGGGVPKKVALTEAVGKVKDASWRESIRRSFIGKFFTPATLPAKNTKRKRITEIMEALETSFPLGINDLVEVAAVIDSAGLKAGDQYLAEAKAMQVESGEQWPDVLENHLTMCKRALRRNKGPEARAKEVRLDSIPEETWERVTMANRNPTRVAWSYAWAAVWMLRAAEAANVLVGHVRIDGGGSKVTLTIPKSKTDQQAAGTTRTLGCCAKTSCARHCPVALAIRALAERPNAKETETLFPDHQGKALTKLQLVTSWVKNLDENMSGHSARRAGAMLYTRMGVDVQTIGFMGRWKSSAVFRHVEEAMREMPLNVAGKEVARHTQPLQPSIRGEVGPPEDGEDATSQGKAIISDRKSETAGPETLWALSTSRGQPLLHKVREASWNIPLSEWKTMCGWHFARHNVKVELTKRPPESAKLCTKCNKIADMRDEVKRAREWAHHVDLDP